MKPFDPSAFVELGKSQASAQGMKLELSNDGNPDRAHIWLLEGSRTHVIALTDKHGEWFPVAESQNYAPDHLANILRRVAYTRITGKFTAPTTEKD